MSCMRAFIVHLCVHVALLTPYVGRQGEDRGGEEKDK